MARSRVYARVRSIRASTGPLRDTFGGGGKRKGSGARLPSGSVVDRQAETLSICGLLIEDGQMPVEGKLVLPSRDGARRTLGKEGEGSTARVAFHRGRKGKKSWAHGGLPIARRNALLAKVKSKQQQQQQRNLP